MPIEQMLEEQMHIEQFLVEQIPIEGIPTSQMRSNKYQMTNAKAMPLDKCQSNAIGQMPCYTV